jgi:hypothetical protein
MKARLIVISATIIGWLPAALLAGSSGQAWSLMLPVSGFCPLPVRSGDPGYSDFGLHAWIVGLAVFFAILGAYAVFRKSISAAIMFASLLFLSEALVVLRVANMNWGGSW